MEALLGAEERNLVMAQSGNEALSLALKHDFALVLLDVQMPEMDGFEVATLMRQNRKTRHIPIIFVTAISKEEQYVFRGYENGAVDYLFKPVNERILGAKVNVFLELDRQRRKLQQAVVQMKRLKDDNERLLHALGDAVMGLDAEGRVTFANQAVGVLLERSRDDILGQPVTELLIGFGGVAEGDDEQADSEGGVLSWENTVLFEQCSQGRYWENPLEVRNADGGESSLPLQAHASPVSRENGAFSGVVLVLRRRPDQGGPGQRERRREPRKRLFRELVVFDRDTGGNVGRLVDLSIGGFRLLLRRDVTPGEQLQLGMVLPERISGVNTMSFNARVVWSGMPEEMTSDEYGVCQAGFQFLDASGVNREIIEILMERY